MRTVLLIVVVLLSLSSVCYGLLGKDFLNVGEPPIAPCNEPVVLILDPCCYCTYNWIGPNGYYNFWTLNDITYATYHDADHWSPFPSIDIIPCVVCFVTIQGAGTTFIDKNTQANDMTIGGNEWDATTVVLAGPGRGYDYDIFLQLDYDDIPVIFSVHGEREVTGQTKITIIGKGFGFEASGLTITVVDTTQDRPEWEAYDAACTYPDQITPKVCPQPGIPSVLVAPGNVYPCTNIRIFHHDSFVSCYIDTPDVFAEEFEITIQTSLRDPTVSASTVFLSTYIK